MEKATARLRVLALLVVVMFLALATRLWFLQVLATQRFDKEATRNSIRTSSTVPLRGVVYDANGHEIIDNEPTLEVRITPDELGDRGERVVLAVSRLTGVPVVQIARDLQDSRYSPSQSIPVASFVPEKVKYYIREHPERFPGVEVEEAYVRRYPFGRLAAHIVGYTGLIDAAQLEQWGNAGYGPDDIVGVAGLESVYERDLHGKPGERTMLVNADGELIRVLRERPPTPGDDLHLTLDMRMQRVAEHALADGMLRARGYQTSTGSYLRANAGVVVVLDADTGGVVAMASNPSYDPRWFVHGRTPEQDHYLGLDDADPKEQNKKAPLVNRASQLSYMPGSTFKPFTGLAAVKEGFATLGGYYACDAKYVKPGDESGTEFHNWTDRNLYPMTMSEALRISCDTFFDQFGGDFYDQYASDPLGENGDRLERDLHEWGFESPTGIDLPSEWSGVVPDPAWASDPERKAIFPYGWVPGGDILTMIGSGYVEVTPLQLARAYAAIANGGHLCEPHIVDHIEDANGDVVRHIGGHCDQTVPYEASQLAYIRNALRAAVDTGTADCAFAGFPLSTISVAGKTGTAVRDPSGKIQDTSWFASMVGPDPDHPEYVVVTMVEQGGFGGETAAPITRHVIDGLYPNELAHDTHPVCHVEDG
jgi:penicillin-binding protein 2